MIGMRKRRSVESEIAALGGLTREELALRWSVSFGRPPPPGVRRDLLCHAAAWRLQAKHHGGLSVEARKLLKKAVARVRSKSNAGPVGTEGRSTVGLLDGLANEGGSSGPASTGGVWGSAASDADPMNPGISDAGANVAAGPASTSRERKSPSIGSRLLRDWNGRTHVVDVIATGFLFEDRTHRSLSAIARQITGAHWSGPRFFGL